MEPLVELSDLVAAVYDAALDPGAWPLMLGRLSSAMNACGASLIVQHTNSRLTRWAVPTGVYVPMFQAYNAHWAALNPMWSPTFAAPPGAVLIDCALVDRDAFRGSEFFNDFVAPLGILSSMAAKLRHDRELCAVVAVARSPRQGEFGPRDAALLGALVPHLQRAVQIHQRLSSLTVERADLAEVMNRLDQGMVLVDACGRVLFANREALAILGAADGLRIGPEGLHAERPEQTRALIRLIAQAAKPDGCGGLGGTIILSRRSHPRPLTVLVAPVRAEVTLAWLAAGPIPAAVILITDPGRTPDLNIDDVRQLYGLTRTEASIAVAVLHGAELREIAESRGVSVTTARTHLQRIFDKTGTRRQADLVRVLLESRLPRLGP